MRFITLVKAAEGFGPPPQSFLDALARPTEEGMRSGKLVATGGLAPTAEGARVRLANGKVTVTDGPFTEAKEVIGGWAVLELASREEAVESCVWLMELHRQHWPGWEGEVEIREMRGSSDVAP